MITIEVHKSNLNGPLTEKLAALLRKISDVFDGNPHIFVSVISRGNRKTYLRILTPKVCLEKIIDILKQLDINTNMSDRTQKKVAEELALCELDKEFVRG